MGRFKEMDIQENETETTDNLCLFVDNNQEVFTGYGLSGKHLEEVQAWIAKLYSENLNSKTESLI